MSFAYAQAQAPTKTPENRENAAYNTKKVSTFVNSARSCIFLQRTVGNQVVQRQIRLGSIQAKLRMSQPNDAYEQEAERAAEQIAQMTQRPLPERELPSIKQVTTHCPEMNRLSEPDAKKSEMPTIYAPASSLLIQNVLYSPGEPLDIPTRTYFEPRFGYNFSKVRVHKDAKVAEAVNARAFTVGIDIVFGKGEYAPHTQKGCKLLAHELTHIIQQNDRPETSSKFDRNRYAITDYPRPANTEANTKIPFQITHLPYGSLLQRDDLPTESRAREILARADLEKEGWAVLSDNDAETRKILGIPENEPAADLLAKKGPRSWLIGDSKGRDPSSFTSNQGPNTKKYLKKLHPDARLSFRVYVKQTTNLADLGSGLSAPSGFLVEKRALGEAKPGVEPRTAEHMVRIEGEAVQVRGSKVRARPSQSPPAKTPPRTPIKTPPVKPPAEPIGGKRTIETPHATMSSTTSKRTTPKSKMSAGEAIEAKPKTAIKGAIMNLAAGVALNIFTSYFHDYMLDQVAKMPLPKIDRRSAAEYLSDRNARESMQILDLFNKNLKPFERELMKHHLALIGSTNLELVALKASGFSTQQRLNFLTSVENELDVYLKQLLVVYDNTDAMLELETEAIKRAEAAEKIGDYINNLWVADYLLKIGFSLDEIVSIWANLKAFAHNAKSTFKDAHNLRNLTQRLIDEASTLDQNVNRIYWFEVFKGVKEMEEVKRRSK
jgi:hypothetical protein